ncbi:MAG: FAD:protein FMN transferase [Actinomycetota bacterium]|nr:FAD:protein FMN transferase [Actinomycetota bacterium]
MPRLSSLRKNRWILILSIGLMALILWWALRAKGYTQEPYVKERVLLGTYVSIKAYGKDQGRVERAVNEAMSEMEKVHRLMNFFDPSSEISKINQNAGKKGVRVSSEVTAVVSLSKAYGQKTAGAFDITVGPLTQLWNFEKKPHIPTKVELDEKLPLLDLKSISIGRKNNLVKLEKPGMRLDLGGVAKGYATDKAIEALKRHGISQALVTTGSTTRVIGSKPRSKPWRIGIQHPRSKKGEEEIIGILKFRDDKSVSTSGDYQRYFVKKGRRYHHILDPKTGMPIEGLMSVTVVTSRSCTEADILSTAIFVMGYPKGMNFIEQTKDLEGVIITSDGKACVSSGLKGKIENLIRVIQDSFLNFQPMS